MGLYNRKKPYFDTLKWSDIFPDKVAFRDKMTDTVVSMNAKLEPLYELYDMLYLRYHSSNTRYTSELPFILAIKREMVVAWPLYVQQKALMEEMLEMEIAEIQRESKSIANTIDRPTVDLPDKPSEEVIPNLSTTQQSLFNLGNKLRAVRDKYLSIDHDYLDQIYSRLDVYFRGIQVDETFILYEQED